ncbi:hypothetical protein Tco_0066350 [Tanacetum coccineum]
MSSLDRSSTTISDLYKGLDVITQLLKDINNDVKDDHAAHSLKQEEASAAWTKSSTNMAWNLGSRMTAIEISQTTLKRFQGSNPLHLLQYVTPTLALTHIPANVKGENATNTATEEPPSHTEGETRDTTMAIPISSIHPTEVQPTHDQPITLVISHPENSHATLRIDKGKGLQLSQMRIPKKDWCLHQPSFYWDKEEKIKKADEEAKLLAMSRPKVIKVVREEAKKLGIDPKEAISTKAGETFKKAQDAEHEVLKREHSKKVKRLTKLNKRRAKEYMWTMTNRIKPERIIDIRIHPNTKPIIAFVFRDNDKRNIDVHQPFKDMTEEDHADYPTDGGDDDDEPSDDDDDDDDDDDTDEEPFKD